MLLDNTLTFNKHARGGSKIFLKGVHIILRSTSKEGGPGGGAPLGPMFKSLQFGPKRGEGSAHAHPQPNQDFILEVVLFIKTATLFK